MARCVYSDVTAVLVVSMSASIVFGMSGRAFGDSNCFERPNLEPTRGAHWYYRYDREKNRKCWHLDAVATRTRAGTLPWKDQAEGIAPPVPVIASVFSALFGPWPIARSEPFTLDAAASEPRIIQSNPTKPLKIEDIAQQYPDLPEEHAETRYVTPLSSAQRKALFEEYLKWEEIQRSFGTASAPLRLP